MYHVERKKADNETTDDCQCMYLIPCGKNTYLFAPCFKADPTGSMKIYAFKMIFIRVQKIGADFHINN